MDNTNLELFKQALSEGLSGKIDSVANEYTEEIVYSEKHNLAMRTIVYGKTDTKRFWSPKMKRIIAILVAAALILTSCGIIFRNEIRDFVEYVYELFIAVTYTDENPEGTAIKEVYELTYVPEGYYLEEEKILTVNVRYMFSSSEGEKISFDQCSLDGTNFVSDMENGYTRIIDIQKYEIYYKSTDGNHYYLWNDSKYSMRLISTTELPSKEIQLIVEGIALK